MLSQLKTTLSLTFASTVASVEYSTQVSQGKNLTLSVKKRSWRNCWRPTKSCTIPTKKIVAESRSPLRKETNWGRSSRLNSTTIKWLSRWDLNVSRSRKPPDLQRTLSPSKLMNSMLTCLISCRMNHKTKIRQVETLHLLAQIWVLEWTRQVNGHQVLRVLSMRLRSITLLTLSGSTTYLLRKK